MGAKTSRHGKKDNAQTGNEWPMVQLQPRGTEGEALIEAAAHLPLAVQ